MQPRWKHARFVARPDPVSPTGAGRQGNILSFRSKEKNVLDFSSYRPGHSTSVRFSFAFSGDFERYGDSSPIGQPHSFRVAKNNRSKSVCTLFQRKHLNNQTVWPVIFGLAGPICARALKSLHLFELLPRGHHDWPVKPINQLRLVATLLHVCALVPKQCTVLSG